MTVDGARVVTADVVSEKNRYHHDSDKLAAAIMRLYSGRNQLEAAGRTGAQCEAGTLD